METLQLYDSEYKLMELIWEYAPVRSTELAKIAYLRLGWKKSTVFTMIRKLVEKGVIQNEHSIVTALLSRKDIQSNESERFLKRDFNGSLPDFIASFVRNNKLSEKDRELILKLLE